LEKIAKSDYKLWHFCLSVHMEQLGSHWTDFHEIWYFIIFRNSVEKIQVSLNFDNNNRHFTHGPIHICDHISLIYLKMRNVSNKVLEKIKTHISLSKHICFFRKSRPL